MNVQERSYPQPAMDPESIPFWEGTSRGVLLLKRCRECGRTHYYPRSICPHCFGSDTEWFEASGRGVIYAYSVTRRVEVPYVIAYVRLAEGVTIMSNIVEADADRVRIGDPVEMVMRAAQGGASLPMFRPAAAAAPGSAA